MLIVSLKNAVDEIESVLVNGNEILFSDLSANQTSLINEVLENYQSSFHIPEFTGNIIINKNELPQSVFSKPSALIPYNSLISAERKIIDNLINTFL